MIQGAWGGLDAADVLAFLDAALEDPALDAGRVGIMGGSYGGYLTALLLGRTTRFAAGISERAFTDPVSFVGSSDIGWFFPDAYLGTDPERIAAQSAMAAAGAITTPTLVIHSEEDWRCPVEQGARLYVELKRRGVPTELLLFPGEGHELSRSGRPRHRLARFEHILRWWARWLPTAENPGPGAPSCPPGRCGRRGARPRDGRRGTADRARHPGGLRRAAGDPRPQPPRTGPGDAGPPAAAGPGGAAGGRGARAPGGAAGPGAARAAPGAVGPAGRLRPRRAGPAHDLAAGGPDPADADDDPHGHGRRRARPAPAAPAGAGPDVREHVVGSAAARARTSAPWWRRPPSCSRSGRWAARRCSASWPLRHPGLDAEAVAFGVSYWVPWVQPPPRGLWGASGAAVMATVDAELGPATGAPMTPEDLVTRYLTAFGPATVRDVQAWCGLTRLREVADADGAATAAVPERRRRRAGRRPRRAAAGPGHARAGPLPRRVRQRAAVLRRPVAGGRRGRPRPAAGRSRRLDRHGARRRADAGDLGGPPGRRHPVLTVRPSVSAAGRRPDRRRRRGRRLLEFLAPGRSHDVRFLDSR